MAMTFDGPNKLIIFDSGTQTTTAAAIYSRWKDWVQSGNAEFLKAFNTVGGDPLGNNIYITPYFFLTNSWKIRPWAASHTLTIGDNLLTDDNSSPFNFPSGGYSIEVVRQFALKTETVNGTGDPFTFPLESSMTRDEALRTILSFSAGIASGLNGPVSHFKSQDGTKDRIVATLDSLGNRTVTLVDGT